MNLTVHEFDCASKDHECHLILGSSVVRSVPPEKSGFGWGQPVLDMVLLVSLSYYIMLFIVRLFTVLFSFSVLVRAGTV